MTCAPSEDSNQPGHPPSLIRVFAVHMKKHWALNYLLSAQWRLWSDWADAQADLSLRWAHIILLVLSCGSSYQDDGAVSVMALCNEAPVRFGQNPDSSGFKPPTPWPKVGNSNHLVMLMVCNFQYFLVCCTGMKSTCRFQQLIYTVMSQQRPKESFSWEETISRIDLSDFSLCIVGYSRFWLKVADEESKCIPHEFPRFRAKTATVWCFSDYCLQQCKRVKHNTEDNSIICTIWAASWQNQQNDCVPSKDSDQPGHPPSLIRVFAVRSMGS